MKKAHVFQVLTVWFSAYSQNPEQRQMHMLVAGGANLSMTFKIICYIPISYLFLTITKENWWVWVILKLVKNHFTGTAFFLYCMKVVILSVINFLYLWCKYSSSQKGVSKQPGKYETPFPWLKRKMKCNYHYRVQWVVFKLSDLLSFWSHFRVYKWKMGNINEEIKKVHIFPQFP